MWLSVPVRVFALRSIEGLYQHFVVDYCDDYILPETRDACRISRESVQNCAGKKNRAKCFGKRWWNNYEG